MKAIVEKEVCTGCGLCANTCPEVFEMVDDVAVVKGEVVPEAAAGSAKEAAQNCPVEAIVIEE